MTLGAVAIARQGEQTPGERRAETLPSRFDVLEIEREVPDTARHAEFDGHAMVQSFLVPLPDGRRGRCWITTSDALRIDAFGRAWIARALHAHVAAHGAEATLAALRAGTLRLRAGPLVPDHVEPGPASTIIGLVGFGGAVLGSAAP